jgi:hypothetical protein
MKDATKFAGSSFIKLSDVEDASIFAMIEAVEEDSKFDKLNLILDSGRKFSVNKTNCAKLIKAFGKDYGTWPDHEIELAAGELPFQGSTTPGVVVKPVDGEAEEAKAKPKPKANAKPSAESDGKPWDNSLDDTIPY